MKKFCCFLSLSTGYDDVVPVPVAGGKSQGKLGELRDL